MSTIAAKTVTRSGRWNCRGRLTNTESPMKRYRVGETQRTHGFEAFIFAPVPSR